MDPLDPAARLQLTDRGILRPGMIWPLDPEVVREFAAGLDEIFVVEEKRPFLERQIKEILYGSLMGSSSPFYTAPWLTVVNGTLFFAAPDHRNTASLRCLAKAGFVEGIWFDEPQNDGSTATVVGCTLDVQIAAVSP